MEAEAEAERKRLAEEAEKERLRIEAEEAEKERLISRRPARRWKFTPHARRAQGDVGYHHLCPR